MLRKLIPVLIGLVALIAGGAAGWVLRPAPAAVAEGGDHAAAAPAGDHAEAPAEGDSHGTPEATPPPAPSGGHGEPASAGVNGMEYVKLNNQFVVPLIDGGRVKSMVMLSLSLEVTAGSRERVFAVEPKLRDIYLRVMFDHANAGGFAGTFTDRTKLDTLRATLAEVSRPLLGDALSAVLIEDIVRQDNG